MTPIESTFVTSSYVKTPATPNAPLILTSPIILTPPATACAFVSEPNFNVAASIPVKAVPLPTKLVAVQTPVTIKPLVAVGAPFAVLFVI